MTTFLIVVASYTLLLVGLYIAGQYAELERRRQARARADANDEVWAAFERARAHTAPVPPPDDPAQEGTP